ncbi:MAG: hypothetical protein ACHQ01_01365 [Candidatus Limnocylindrales bacterium]
MAGARDSGDVSGAASSGGGGAVLPDDQRRALLKRAVFDLTREARAQVRTQGEFDALVVRGAPVNHRLHFVAVMVMAALALAVGEGLGAGPSGVAALLVVPGAYALWWLFLAATGGEELERISIDESGKIDRVKSGRDVETRGDFARVAVPLAVIAVSTWTAVGLTHDIAFPPPPNCNAPASSGSDACLLLPNIETLTNASAQLISQSPGPVRGTASPASPSAAASAPIPAASPSTAGGSGTGALSVDDTKLLERVIRSLQLVAALAFLLGSIWFLRRMLAGRWVGFIRPLHRHMKDE